MAVAAFGPPDVTTTLDVIVTRGDLVESRHRVHAAVVDWTGGLRMAARNAHMTTWWRSCAKPFQVMPMVERGQFRALGWGPDELALACASHGGEPEHVALAGAMLARIGLEEGDLVCGPHEPLSSRGARLLRESGHRVTRLHNNCSGKHSAMLARAVQEGWATAGYEQQTHPVQVAAHDTVSRWSGVPPDGIRQGVDGCGVTVFALPLANMALSYARLAHAAKRGDDAPAQIVAAMTGNPFLIGGSDRFDTLLMDACGGRVLCKIGAEGVHTLALLEQGVGIALKVEDGAHRAQYPAVLAILAALGELPDPLPDALRELTGRQVRNTRGEVVGEIRVSALRIGDTSTVVADETS
ncbi:MAG: asparaginase, partial [Gemmatimonas sp.]